MGMKPLIDYTSINEAFVPTAILMLMVGAVLDIGSCASYSAKVNLDTLDVMRNWILDDASQKVLSRLNGEREVQELRGKPRYLQDKEWKDVYEAKVSKHDIETLLKAQKGLMKA